MLKDWTSQEKAILALVICMALVVTWIGIETGIKIQQRVAFAQEPVPQPTGYFVEVKKLTVQADITATPIGEFVVYDKDKTKVIWSENVSLGTYTTDEQLETVIDAWANPYIERFERQKALDNLSKTSTIIGKKLDHKK